MEVGCGTAGLQQGRQLNGWMGTQQLVDGTAPAEFVLLGKSPQLLVCVVVECHAFLVTAQGQPQRPRLVSRWITHATLRSPLVLCQVRRNDSPALPLTGTS